VGHRCLDYAHGRAANTHLTTIMTAEKLADEIRREAKAGSVEHGALNSRPGANVCIWHFCDLAGNPTEGRFRLRNGHHLIGSVYSNKANAAEESSGPHVIGW
jgi:hypothetical protein